MRGGGHLLSCSKCSSTYLAGYELDYSSRCHGVLDDEIRSDGAKTRSARGQSRGETPELGVKAIVVRAGWPSPSRCPEEHLDARMAAALKSRQLTPLGAEQPSRESSCIRMLLLTSY